MVAAVHGGSSAGVIQVMVAAALWATVGVASKLVPATETLSDLALGVSRLAVGGPVILAIALVIRHEGLNPFRRLEPGALFGFAVGCAVFQLCLFRAFTLLGVTATVFLTVCLPPLLACGWSLLRGRAVLTPAAVGALALASAGLIVFAAGNWSATAPEALVPGLALAVIASVAFVAMTASAREMTLAVGPLVVVAAGLTLAGLLMLAALLLVDPASVALPVEESWKVVGLTLYLGLGPTALAYVVYCSGMARCRSAGLGLIASMVEPGLAALLAWMVLSERLGPAESIGCALVMGAMVLLWWSERAHPAQD